MSAYGAHNILGKVVVRSGYGIHTSLIFYWECEVLARGIQLYYKYQNRLVIMIIIKLTADTAICLAIIVECITIFNCVLHTKNVDLIGGMVIMLLNQ